MPLDFYASKNSPLAKTRRHALIFGAFAASLTGLRFINDLAAMLLMLSILTTIFGLIDYFLRKKLRPGKPVVTLTDESITSPNLSGEKKQLFWKDIKSCSELSQQGHPCIEFLLRESPAVGKHLSLWIGVNQATPRLPLSAFSPEDQNRLVGEIRQRHFKSCSPEEFVRLEELHNASHAEREFAEKLISLQPHTWVTYVLIALNLLIWVGSLTQGAEFARTPADKLLSWGGNAASEVQKGEYWRLLTASFLHGSFLHVAMNMLGLYSAGVAVERIYGKRLYSLIYLASGLMGSVLSLYFSAQNVVSVGASGAVFGVTGALLVAVSLNRDTLPKAFSQQTISGMVLFIVYSLIQGFSIQGIDNAAHIGGLAGGCLAALILPERFDPVKYRRVFRQRAAVTFAVIALLVIGGTRLSPKAPIDQGTILASQAIVMRSLQKFDRGLQELQREARELKSGRLSAKDADIRSRTVMAPIFHDIVADLSQQVVLHPNDPRGAVVQDIKRMSELLAEQLAMESVFDEKTQKFEPADPARAEQIAAELKPVNDRIIAFIKQADTKKQ
ncbi:MAG: rhomboid family intramembrane serine protease [Betaproteobacteria bacterium]